MVAILGIGAWFIASRASSHNDPSPSATIPAWIGPRPRNVLLITIDTLRADHMSSHGYARRTTPNLDRLMAEGTRFDCALSTTSITVPSHVAILTGLHSSWTSIQLENGQQYALDESTTTLAELCRDAGLYTAAVVSSETLIHKVGLDQGFADYDDRIVERKENHPTRKQPADTSCQKMLRLLKQHGDKPFFGWLHLMDPHGPYAPPREWIARMAAEPAPTSDFPPRLPHGRDHGGYQSIPIYQRYNNETAYADYVRRYDAEIAFADEQLGLMLTELRQRGLLEQTLVIVTADHGEALGEDDFYFAHTQSVGLDQVRVPLAFIGPGVKAGHVIDRPVSNIDIFATVCSALQLEPPTRIASGSLVECLAGRTPPSNSPAFTGAMSQWGAAQGELYYRRDRRPANDAAFWAKNYNSDAPHKPIGERLVRLRDGSSVALSEAAAIKQHVDNFDREAEAASKNVPRLRKVGRDRNEKIRLRNLGYLGGDDSPATKPALPPATRP